MILLFLWQTQKLKASLFACAIFCKICYVACAISRAGKLICLRACLLERDRTCLTDKPGMSPDDADEAKTEYLKFIDTHCLLIKYMFLAFDAANGHVDTFLGTFLHGQKEYPNLRKICLFVFVL